MRASHGVLALALALAGVLSAGCTSIVTINTDPQGAKCFINDEYCGTTPLVTPVESWALGAKPRIRLDKKGYDTYAGELRKRLVGRYIVMDLFALGFAPVAMMFNATLVDGVYHFPLCKTDEEDLEEAENEPPEEPPVVP